MYVHYYSLIKLLYGHSGKYICRKFPLARRWVQMNRTLHLAEAECQDLLQNIPREQHGTYERSIHFLSLQVFCYGFNMNQELRNILSRLSHQSDQTINTRKDKKNSIFFLLTTTDYNQLYLSVH